MTSNIILKVFALVFMFSLTLGCQCLDKTDLKEFVPSDYSEFVTDAFSDYWKVLDDNEKQGVNPLSWESFANMKEQFYKNKIDVEKEFITRMLKVDKLWVSYEADRNKYEQDNPGKTYLDQIAYFITETPKIYKPQTQTQTKTVFLNINKMQLVA